MLATLRTPSIQRRIVDFSDIQTAKAKRLIGNTAKRMVARAISGFPNEAYVGPLSGTVLTTARWVKNNQMGQIANLTRGDRYTPGLFRRMAAICGIHYQCLADGNSRHGREDTINFKQDIRIDVQQLKRLVTT